MSSCWRYITKCDVAVVNPLRRPENSWKHAGFAKLFQILPGGGEAWSLLDTKIKCGKRRSTPGGVRARSKMRLCCSAPWGYSLRGPLGDFFFFRLHWLLLWFGHTLAGFREEGWSEGHKRNTTKSRQSTMQWRKRAFYKNKTKTLPSAFAPCFWPFVLVRLHLLHNQISFTVEKHADESLVDVLSLGEVTMGFRVQSIWLYESSQRNKWWTK